MRISDPDLSKAHEEEISKTDAVTAQSAPRNAAPPGKENGKAGETVAPQGVQVEVNASQPQNAEDVKLKDKSKSKCKCCVVQ